MHDAVHVGHSTGGGEVVHYIARHGQSRVAKAVLISSVPPLMVQTDANPGGLPKSVFDDLQAQLAANRSVFYRALASGPFYGFNRPGVESSEAIIQNWWRQGMMGGAKAHQVRSLHRPPAIVFVLPRAPASLTVRRNPLTKRSALRRSRRWRLRVR